jgi:beta-lactamase regulating signal transducer with metallopeptidase domain
MTLNGLCAAAVWYVYRKITEPYGYWKQSYVLIKILILFSLIPVQYILFQLYERLIIRGWWRIIPQYDISIVMSIVLLVWLGGAIRKGIRILSSFFLQKKRLKGSEIADTETIRRYRTIASKMGLRRVPKLYTFDNCAIPFLFHSFPAAICLPENLMDQEQMEISIQHELTHYMHRDHLWAWLLRICCILQWWNPFMNYMERQYREWSEYADDSEIIGKPFDTRYYFEVIMDILENRGGRNVYAQSLGSETTDDIEMRIEMYNKGRKARRSRKTWRVNTLLALALIACITVTMLFGNVASYAYYNAYQEASSMRDIEEEYIPEVYTEQTETGFPKNMEVIEGEVTDLGTGSKAPSFIWNVPGNTAMTSSSFYLEKGQQAAISILSTNPAGISVKFGLLRVATNSKIYITASAPVSYVFTAPAAGYYKMFVENTGGSAYTVNGTYVIL